ncbi:MAG: class I SAM-dependent methyltransferase [Proteobacteria bacterium]|nr:class I SAM-dependent methyltransferase [Pseudomonadota bacterium]
MPTVNEVPSPIDFRIQEDALEWERTALEKRPDRPLFFERFATEIRRSESAVGRVLELGSGPGFLAKHLLEHCRVDDYVALDFSGAMHDLARTRLDGYRQRVTFVERSFKAEDWMEDLGIFDCVVTNQAVHELRHKSLAKRLHEQVRTVLSDEGFYLVNDHFSGPDGMTDCELYMTREEQIEALFAAGFTDVQALLCQSKMALLRAS